MESPLSPSITCIIPKAAPKDSFLGPEFADFQLRPRREKKCSCTACGTLRDSSVEKLFAHPVLKVLICEPCHRFYFTGPFTKDDDGFDEQCRWCGQGGNLIMCDFCTNAFCNYCIKRNFSKKVFADISDKPKFKCFVCNPSKLKSKVEECRKFVNDSGGNTPLRPQDGQSSVPESLTKENEMLDAIIGPLERSLTTDEYGHGKYNESNKENHVQGRRVNPITILKNKESYVIQQRSLSCDESSEVKDTSKYQSDPETSTVRKGYLQKRKNVEDKINKLTVERLGEKEMTNLNVPEISSLKGTNFRTENNISDLEHPHKAMQQEAESAAKTIPNTGFEKHSISRNNLSCGVRESDGNLYKANTVSFVKINPSKSRKPNLNGGQDLIQMANHRVKSSDKVWDDIKKGNPNLAAVSTESNVARRKNIGRRRGEKALKTSRPKSSSDELPSTSKVTVAQFDSTHNNELKHSNFDNKLHLASEYFQCFMHLMKEVVAEECPVSFGKALESCQSPSQYRRFRAASTMLSKVKKASSKLIRLEHDLRAIKTQLGTYRESCESRDSSRSGTDDDDEDDDDGDSQVYPKRSISRRATKCVTNLATSFTPAKEVEASPEEEVAQEYVPDYFESKSGLRSSGLNDEDEKLKISPKVIIKRMTAEEILSKGSRNLSATDDNFSSTLDSDSSKRYQNSFSDSSVTELTSDEENPRKPVSKQKTEKADISGKVKSSAKTKGVQKRKSYEDDESDYEMEENSESESDITTGMETDEDIISFKNGDEIDNAIAKEMLLQQMQNHNFDSDDSDVAQLLNKGDGEVEGEKMKKINKRYQGSKGSTRSANHPLLNSNWKDSSGGEDKNVVENGSSGELKSTIKRKRGADKRSDEMAAKKRNVSFESFDPSEVDLSTDSDDDDSMKHVRSRTTRSKNRMVISDSDSEIETTAKPMQNVAGEDGDSSDDDIEDDNGPEQKRKRQRVYIKSERIDHDKISEPVEESKKGGRRNIRKVLDDDEVSQSTQQAKKEELSRRKRLEAEREGEEEKQDIIIIDEETNVEINKTVTVRLILSKNPLVEVDRGLVKCFKPHQVQGIQFIWDNLIEKVDVANTKRGTGCILSHCMGLGKTLQTVAFLHTVLLCDELPKLRSALILCPSGVVFNWKQEFKKWIPKSNQFSDPERKRLQVSDLNDKSDSDRISVLKEWRERGGVLVMGYSLFRTIVKRNQTSTDEPNDFEQCLLKPGPDILVCDEGHYLKNTKSLLAVYVSKVSTRRRLILTGTPLQNNMVEYHCMVSIVKPKLLGDLSEFKNRFVNPIENGQHVDSTNADVKLMKKRAHVLHELLSGCVQRKDHTYFREHLLPKYEYTLKVRLSELQIRLYEKFLSLHATANLKSHHGSLFNDFTKLYLLVCHPRCLEMQKRKADGEEKSDGVEDGNSVSASDESSSSDDSVIVLSDCDEDDEHASKIPKPSSLEDIYELSRHKLRLFIESKSGNRPKFKCRKKLIKLATRYLDENFHQTKEFEEMLWKKSIPELKCMITDQGGNYIGCKEKGELVSLVKSLHIKKDKKEHEWYEQLMPSQEKLYFANEHGGKIVLMLEILRGAEKLGDKVVIFSQSLVILRLIESVLKAEMNDVANGLKSAAGKFAKWIKGKDYYRLDGNLRGHRRAQMISEFNDPRNERARLFLVSTRAGGVGINLIGANRAIVFDVSWNPSHDIQSIFRIYRFGQKKPCYIYRLVAQGTMEERVYERQVLKRSLSFRVVDEQQVLRHFSAADIAELYTFKPDRSFGKKSVQNCAPPRDALLASIINSSDLVVSFHEPDVLFGHQVAEELTEAERKAAWEEYDRENVEEKAVSNSFKNYLASLNAVELLNVCKKADELLNSILLKISAIKENSLSVIATEMRLKDRTITTEKVTETAIQQKLSTHIMLRRLLTLKKDVIKHKNMAWKMYQERPSVSTSNLPRAPNTTMGATFPPFNVTTAASSSSNTANFRQQRPSAFPNRPWLPRNRGGHRFTSYRPQNNPRSRNPPGQFGQAFRFRAQTGFAAGTPRSARPQNR